PGFSLAKIVETISARPYTVRREPGNGPGQVFHWRKSSRRFPRDPTHLAACQATALARFFMGKNRRDDFRETLRISRRARERPWPAIPGGRHWRRRWGAWGRGSIRSRSRRRGARL